MQEGPGGASSRLLRQRSLLGPRELSHRSSCVTFRATMATSRQLGRLNNQKSLSRSSRGLKSKTQALAGLAPSEHCEGESIRVSPGFCGLLATSGIPWLAVASPQSLPSSSHGILLACLSVSVSKFPWQSLQLGFPASRMVETMNFCCLSLPVDGVLLRRPKQIKVQGKTQCYRTMCLFNS